MMTLKQKWRFQTNDLFNNDQSEPEPFVSATTVTVFQLKRNVIWCLQTEVNHDINKYKG